MTLSEFTKDKASNEELSFVTVLLMRASDSTLVTSTISNENGLFTITSVKSGEYLLEVSFIGFIPTKVLFL